MLHISACDPHESLSRYWEFFIFHDEQDLPLEEENCKFIERQWRKLYWVFFSRTVCLLSPFLCEQRCSLDFTSRSGCSFWRAGVCGSSNSMSSRFNFTRSRGRLQLFSDTHFSLLIQFLVPLLAGNLQEHVERTLQQMNSPAENFHSVVFEHTLLI